MKKVVFLFLSFVIISCGSTAVKNPKNQPLYQVLTQQETGGANIRFYEILTEPNEIKMLLHDAFLKKKIVSEDIENANFVILNMGEHPTGGYKIGVEEVFQKKDSIIIKIKEVQPKPTDIVVQEITYPYSVVKINSKKPIRIQ
ncbi:protease complex subunit PrcB family protein [Flavobacterium sp. UMI-01]|uniref:protease complex subunit PrcB family protein n=1 Tax=Flavobacterium sp. UMI-01 TaxID=1441053 RepID=UPI001C7DCA6E|nr:protease complex subunit PrcB family protein [Flavobacterium sp. UMI-01]GIZ08151.1 hypothetical protein FUMI01_08780 [Flavobacterium sp. UMI-01]